jgi:hypothetical protein
MPEKLHVLRDAAPKVVVFYCPGCKGGHAIPVEGPNAAEFSANGTVWGWNGSLECPTFTPSILVRTGHYAGGQQSACWCTYNAEHPEAPAPFECTVCHSFVRDGKIQFLGDCTHALAGQTVDLPDWE